MKTTTPVLLWAVIVRTTRTEWVHWYTIRSRKQDAWNAFLEFHTPEHVSELEKERKAGEYRVARVVVALEEVE